MHGIACLGVIVPTSSLDCRHAGPSLVLHSEAMCLERCGLRLAHSRKYVLACPMSAHVRCTMTWQKHPFVWLCAIWAFEHRSHRRRPGSCRSVGVAHRDDGPHSTTMLNCGDYCMGLAAEKCTDSKAQTQVAGGVAAVIPVRIALHPKSEPQIDARSADQAGIVTVSVRGV